MTDPARIDRDDTELIIARHERGLSLLLLPFMVLGIAAGVLMVIAGVSHDAWYLLPGLVAIAIGILSALGRVLIDISRDLKRTYYLD